MKTLKRQATFNWLVVPRSGTGALQTPSLINAATSTNAARAYARLYDVEDVKALEVFALANARHYEAVESVTVTWRKVIG